MFPIQFEIVALVGVARDGGLFGGMDSPQWVKIEWGEDGAKGAATKTGRAPGGSDDVTVVLLHANIHEQRRKMHVT